MVRSVLIQGDRGRGRKKGGRERERERERERRMSAGNGLSTVAFFSNGNGKRRRK